MSRYLHPRPGAVLAWLSVRPPSLERRLFEYLLGAPEPVEFNVPALAAALRHPARAVARALFALNRHASISLQDAGAPLPAGASPAPCAAGRCGLAAVEQDLMEISQAQGAVMLASDDGFCIAQAGLSPQQAQRLAAQRALGDHCAAGAEGVASDKGAATNFRAALCFGHRTLHFYASPGIDLKHPRMLRLGAHLLQGCQPPGVTTGH